MNEPAATPHRSVSPAAAWFTLWALVATVLFSFVDRQVIALVAAPMARDLGLSDSQLGMVLGLGFAIFTVAAAYPIAWLADRIDRRLVLGLCVVIWAGGTAACGLAQNFEQLFAASIAIAAGEAGLAPLALSVVPDLFRGRERVTANLIYYIATMLGISLGLLVGGGAIAALDAGHSTLPEALQSLESWRLAFLLVASPAPLFLVLILFMRLRRPQPTGAESAAAPIGMGAFLREHGRTLALVFGGIAMFGFTFSGLPAWMPAAMERLFGITAAQNGAYLAVGTAVGCVAGVVIASALMRRLQPTLGHRAAPRIAWVAMALSAPGIALYPFVTAAWQAYVLVGLQMTVYSLIGSLTPYVVQGLALANLRARVLAIYAMMYNLIAGASVLASGSVSDMVGGPRSLLWGMAIVALPAIALCVVLFRASERPFERTAAWVGVD
jgi:MFS family permease